MTTLVDDLGVEVRFPLHVSLSMSGGPGFSTQLTAGASGREQRTRNRKFPLLAWQVAATEVGDNFEQFLDFFYLAGGKADSFRIKDHTDFSADYTRGVLGTGVGTGFPTLQLGKIYGYGGASVVRPIYKPFPGSLAVKKNGSLISEGSSAGFWEVDLSQGIITFTASVSKAISAISKASNGVVTSTGHGFTNGQLVYMSVPTGMVEINGLLANVTVLTTDTFSTGINTGNFTTYASGGTAKLYPQPSDTLTASFQFDVLVRFDTDQMTYQVVDKNNAKGLIITWNAVPLVETRTP